MEASQDNKPNTTEMKHGHRIHQRSSSSTPEKAAEWSMSGLEPVQESRQTLRTLVSLAGWVNGRQHAPASCSARSRLYKLKRTFLNMAKEGIYPSNVLWETRVTVEGRDPTQQGSIIISSCFEIT